MRGSCGQHKLLHKLFPKVQLGYLVVLNHRLTRRAVAIEYDELRFPGFSKGNNPSKI